MRAYVETKITTTITIAITIKIKTDTIRKTQTTHLLKDGSHVRAMSVGSIMRSAVGSSNCAGPDHFLPLCVFLGVHFSSTRRRKYSLENVVGARVHGPQ